PTETLVPAPLGGGHLERFLDRFPLLGAELTPPLRLALNHDRIAHGLGVRPGCVHDIVPGDAADEGFRCHRPGTAPMILPPEAARLLAALTTAFTQPTAQRFIVRSPGGGPSRAWRLPPRGIPSGRGTSEWSWLGRSSQLRPHQVKGRLECLKRNY